MGYAVQRAFGSTGRKNGQAVALSPRQSELLNYSHDAIIIMGADRVIQGWNKGAEEIYGWTSKEAHLQVLHDLLQTRAALSTAEVDKILAQTGRWDGELSHATKDGKRIVVDSRQILQRDENENVSGILEINRDITVNKRNEETLRHTLVDFEAAVREKNTLLKELSHRVKNNLAVIASLLQMNADIIDDPAARLALEGSQQRVQSIALIHEHLYATDHYDRVNFAEYVQQLMASLSVALGCQERGISMRVDAEPIDIGMHRAVPCALILNELVTNAFKHAFPERRSDAEVLVSLRRMNAETMEIRIGDNGVGYAGTSDANKSSSVGSCIVEILTRQLGGSLEREPSSGTHLVLRFPAGSSRESYV
jgi:PAS domain S-box-containing protein